MEPPPGDPVCYEYEVVRTRINRVSHTVTSTDVPSGARAFDSGTFSNNETFSVTLSVPGTYVYHCATHPSIMVGARIVVT